MIRSRRRRSVAALAVLASGLALVAPGAGPAAAASCTLEQITDHTTGSMTFNLAMDGDGDRIVIAGSAGLDGNPNPGGNDEVYLVDTTADTITRLTETASGGLQNRLAIDDAGDDVVFASTANIEGANSDLNSEIWHWTPSGVEPITATAAPRAHLTPDISADGSTVVYADNGDGNFDLFLHDVGGAGPDTQLTFETSASGATFPTINDAATRIAYTSDADGTFEVFLHRLTGSPTTTQVTNAAAGESLDPRISGDGTRIVFNSDRNFGGGNSDGSHEVFQYTVPGGTIARLTGGPAPQGRQIVEQTANGRRVVFADGRDLDGEGGGSGQVFVHDRAGNTGLDQITAFADGGASVADVNDDGTRVAILAAADPLGTNPDENTELFVATCGAVGPAYSDVATTNAFYDEIEWLRAAGVDDGLGGGRFRPGNALTRQQMAEQMYNLAGQPAFTPPGTATFSDVPTTSPYFVPIEWLAAEEVASGFAGGVFKPLDAVKRQQVANFLYNLAGQPSFTPPGSPTFVDVPLSHPFFTAVEWLTSEAIASGFAGNRFAPADPVKRQQMARFLFNFATCCTVGV